MRTAEARMKPATSKSELPPSTQLHKAVIAGSQDSTGANLGNLARLSRNRFWCWSAGICVALTFVGTFESQGTGAGRGYGFAARRRPGGARSPYFPDRVHEFIWRNWLVVAPKLDWTTRLHQPANAMRRVGLTAIPYYAWDNHQSDPMKVWLPVAPGAAKVEEEHGQK